MGWSARGLAFAVVATTACGRTGLFADRLGADVDGESSTGETTDRAPAPVPVDCHKVDFLFVIDDSGSMFDHHSNLVANFSVFTEGIQGVVAGGTDLHVGVVTSDVYAGTKDECHVLGGLVTAPTGAHSSSKECGPFAEGNYMTAADDIDAGFACVALVGTEGTSIEQPMDAMLAAIDDEGEAAECNAGFLRPDALLVVVVVTDEWDGPGDPEGAGSLTDPTQWRRGLELAKGGEDAVVFVALVNEVPRQCSPGHEINDGTVLVEFAESLPYGFSGSVCGDYGATLGQALDVVAAACADK